MLVQCAVYIYVASDLYSQIQVINNKAFPIISQQSSSTANMHKIAIASTEMRTDGYH